jgi:hypothetical protein
VYLRIIARISSAQVNISAVAKVRYSEWGPGMIVPLLREVAEVVVATRQ